MDSGIDKAVDVNRTFSSFGIRTRANPHDALGARHGHGPRARFSPWSNLGALAQWHAHATHASSEYGEMLHGLYGAVLSSCTKRNEPLAASTAKLATVLLS